MSKAPRDWGTAIDYAERQIADAQARVRRLKRSIAIFQSLRDAGEPWPETSESGIETFGSKVTFRAKPNT